MKRIALLAIFFIVLAISHQAMAQTFDLTGMGDGYVCRGSMTCSPLGTPQPADVPMHLDAWNLTDGRGVVVTCGRRQVAIFYQYPDQIAVTCAGPETVPVTPTAALTPTVTLPTVTPTPMLTPTVQVSQTLYPALDTSILSTRPTQGFAAQTVLIQDGSAESKASSLLRFDLSTLPPTARVISATLTLHTAKLVFGNRELAIRATNGDWDAAATWDKTAADESIPPLATFTWRTGQPANTRYDVPLVWTESIRNGLLIYRTDELDTRTEFHSSEAADVSLRPTLTLWYEVR